MSSESDSSDYGDELPPDIAEAAKDVSLNLLPVNSKRLYTVTYNNFKTWRSKKKTSSFAEEVFLAYFKEMSENSAASTLWTKYPMLKTTVKNFDNVDISVHHQLIAFLKKTNVGYKKKKSKVFTSVDIEKFCDEAPNEVHLCRKVALIIGICGACRRGEMADITLSNVEDHSTMLLIRIPKTKNLIERSFTITGEFYGICRKYMNLRPENIKHDRFFLHYDKGKCTCQLIGINLIGNIPKQIATWLSLPVPTLYMGHSFRRTSATLLADGGGNVTDLKRHGGWKSSAVAESYVDESLHSKKQINSKITSLIYLKKCSERTNSSMLQSRQHSPIASTSTVHVENYPPISKVPSTLQNLPKIAPTFEIQRPKTSRIVFEKQINIGEFSRQQNISDNFSRQTTSTQQATCGSPAKKRLKHSNLDTDLENVNQFEELQKYGNISFHNMTNCNVTLNVNNYYNEPKSK